MDVQIITQCAHTYVVGLINGNQVIHNDSRVESGSNDPNYLGHLGHFFSGSSGSHPQAKLSGCDPDF